MKYQHNKQTPEYTSKDPIILKIVNRVNNIKTLKTASYIFIYKSINYTE